MINLKASDWSIEGVECVLFDKDGTFVDLHHFWGKMTEMRALEVIKKYNLSQEKFELICSFLGYDINNKKMLPDGITALYSRVKIIEIFNKNLNEMGVMSTNNDIEILFDNVSDEFYKNIDKYTKPINSAINFIKNLYEKNIALGVVTSDSVTSTNLTLKQFDFGDMFQVVVGRESSEYTKESGFPTKIALKELKADRKKTIMIGDAPMDYISAKNAGIEHCILVATGQINKEELLKTSNFTVNDLSEIIIY